MVSFTLNSALCVEALHWRASGGSMVSFSGESSSANIIKFFRSTPGTPPEQAALSSGK